MKPGMSGAPVLDLGTGRVVAIMKRTQDAIQAIGGFATGMARIHGKIPELFDANDKANSTETRDQDLAQALWGPRVRDAAEPLIHSAAARDAIIELLELPDKELHGDPKLDAERIARELFVRDLETLAECVDPAHVHRERGGREQGLQGGGDVHQPRGRALGGDGRRCRVERAG